MGELSAIFLEGKEETPATISNEEVRNTIFVGLLYYSFSLDYFHLGGK